MKRSLSPVFLTIIACILCLGQTCAPSSTPTEAGPTSIPGGTYAGQLSATVQVLLNGSVEREYFATVPLEVTFDQDGILLVPGSGPLYVGYTHTLVVGEVALTITVTSIETTATGLNVGYFTVATMEYNSVQVTLNGTGQIGYSVTSGSGLISIMTFDTTYQLLPFVTLGAHIECTGTLTSQ